jgi:hypothetical protein
MVGRLLDTLDLLHWFNPTTSWEAQTIPFLHDRGNRVRDCENDLAVGLHLPMIGGKERQIVLVLIAGGKMRRIVRINAIGRK